MAIDKQTPTPLVGRSTELDQLATAAGIGADPVPAAVVLGGDAGVGKTRLLDELRSRAVEAGWRVPVGHCLDFGDSALPYLPFSEIFGRLGAAEPEVLAELAQAHPAITRLQPGRRLLGAGPEEEAGSRLGPVGEGRDDSMARGELFEGVHAALEQLGRAAPVLVIVEDAHWADRSTCDMLSFLFARGFRTPVSLVVSYRSDDLHRRHPLRARVAEWGRMPQVSRMHLEALADADVRSLVRAIGSARLSARDLHEIVRRAEGNAFFAEELLVAREMDQWALPTDLADLLLIRLDGLDDAGRTVVRAASCAGRRVPHPLLSEVVDLPPERLDEALRAAVDANILVPMADASYAFRHALLAEAVYDDLLPGERTRAHAAYVTALVERRVGGSAAELARHARAAHDKPTAVTASIEAGDDAMKVGGPDEAARHYQLALELLTDARVAEEVDVDQVKLTLRAADALLVSGHFDRSAALLRDALDTMGRDLSAHSRARLLLSLATATLANDEQPVAPLTLTTEALDLLGSESTPLRASALSVHARANIDRAQLDEAARFAQEAVDLATELGADRTAVEAATTLGRIKDFLGDPEASAAALNEVVDRARQAGHVVALIRGLHQLGGTYLEMGDPVTAREHYQEAADLAAANGRRWAPYGLDARALAGIAGYMTGDWASVDEVVDTSDGLPPPAAEALLGAVRLSVMAGRGDPGAPALVERLRPWWTRDGWTAIVSAGAAIDVFGDAGDLERATLAHRDVVAAVTDLWQVPGFQAQVRLGAVLLAHLAAAAATASTAERRRLLDHAHQLVAQAERAVQPKGHKIRVQGPEGQAWQTRIRAEMLRLQWLVGIDTPGEDELRSAWERAVTAFEVLGHEFETARSRVRLAAVLTAQGDGNNARVALDLAHEVAQRLGALPLLSEIRALDGDRHAATAKAERSVAGDGPAGPGLTPREREVLNLVAQGRSNGEVARQLFISTKTVSVHVSNILAKFGASGRTEAAAMARRQGLLG